MLNKRKHFRAPISIGALPPAKLTFLKPFFYGPVEVEIQDLSVGGMKVHSTETFPLYFEFSLEFQLLGTRMIEAKAKAVHQVAADYGYDIGVTFTEIDSDIKAYVNAIATDHQKCEERIRLEEKETCLRECRFTALCQKPQKTKFQD